MVGKEKRGMVSNRCEAKQAGRQCAAGSGCLRYGWIPSIMTRKACKQDWEYSAAAAETIRTNPTVSTPGVAFFDRMLRIYVMKWPPKNFWNDLHAMSKWLV